MNRLCRFLRLRHRQCENNHKDECGRPNIEGRIPDTLEKNAHALCPFSSTSRLNVDRHKVHYFLDRPRFSVSPFSMSNFGGARNLGRLGNSMTTFSTRARVVYHIWTTDPVGRTYLSVTGSR